MRLAGALFFLGIWITAGCGRDSPSASTLTLATLNCAGWQAQASTSPEHESLRQDILDQLGDIQADVLALQGLSSKDDLDQILQILSKRGLNYPVSIFSKGKTRNGHALLSRIENTQTLLHTGLTYRIANKEILVAPPFIEARILSADTNAPPIKILSAFLAPSEADIRSSETYEIRRNEARLLGQEARRSALDSPEGILIVMGSFQDSPQSTILRTISSLRDEKPYLIDIAAQDDRGERWTHKNEVEARYQQTDYILLNATGNARMVSTSARIHSAAGKTNPYRAVSVQIRTGTEDL